MCKAPDSNVWACVATVAPRHLSAKHQRRAPIDKETSEVCIRKRFLQSVNLNMCVNMTNLRVINLSCNKLSMLPATITLISTLEKLYVNNNQLVELPKDIGRLRNLKVLDCSGNRIRCLPDSITELTNLETLRIGAAGNGNMIKTLPESLGNLRELVDLQLDNNELLELPVSITRLLNLRTLNARNNRLMELPEGLGYMQSLERVDLSHNRLVSLPRCLGEARAQGKLRIRMLDVSFNLLQSVAHELCTQVLDVSDFSFLLAGNPMLEAETAVVPTQLTTQRRSCVRSLLEMALHVCTTESGSTSGTLLAQTAAVEEMPEELQQLLHSAPRCSVCTRRCVNTITEPRVVRVRALGYTHLPAEVSALCQRCSCSLAANACDREDAHQ